MFSAALRITVLPLTKGRLSSHVLPAIGTTSARFSGKAPGCLSKSNKSKSSGSQNKPRIAVIGACGGIGQPLALLLKLNPSIGELILVDKDNMAGVAADLSHIETPAKVSHFTTQNPGDALKGGVDIIVLPAGVPRKPGMKRSDLFVSNAKVVYDTAKAMGEHSPDSILLIITNPVNSVVPVACEVLKNQGKLNPKKIFGASTLDSVRAATFIGEITNTDPREVVVPLIGGHSGTTIIPLLSRSHPSVTLEGEKRDEFVKKLQNAGTAVVQAKAGKGSATLAMAYAGSRLCFGIIRAMQGESNVVESAYVVSDIYPELKYLATPLLLGKNGIEKNLGLGKMNDYETDLFCKAVPQMKKDVALGEKYVKEQGGGKSIC
ncbi:unnamed protein product [Ceutorhynchus assimilis]|uniref:Malate dehydrogenase, mitochondrial n=1 Tax=Ceutorhynchus assimilis TaxID=467358 RepID=A0A9N9QDF6_9CUCU|nr:unnamed protein product [Ceutorhynchus assimilis]